MLCISKILFNETKKIKGIDILKMLLVHEAIFPILWVGVHLPQGKEGIREEVNRRSW